MWTEITRDEYHALGGGQNYRPVSSFSDPEGTNPIGYGRPAMDTYWGTDPESPMLYHEMRKESRHDPEWLIKYYRAG